MNKLLFALLLIFNLNVFCGEVDDLVTSPISQGSAQESDSESIQGDAQKDAVVEALLKEAEKQERLRQEMEAKHQAKESERKKLNREYFEGLKKDIRQAIDEIQHHINIKNHSHLIKKLDLIIRKLIVYYYRADTELRAEIDSFIEEFQDEQISSLSAIYGSDVIASLFAQDDNDEKSRNQFMALLTLCEPELSEGEQMTLHLFKNSLVPKKST